MNSQNDSVQKHDPAASVAVRKRLLAAQTGLPHFASLDKEAWSGGWSFAQLSLRGGLSNLPQYKHDSESLWNASAVGAAEGQAEAKAGGIHQPTADIAYPHHPLDTAKYCLLRKRRQGTRFRVYVYTLDLFEKDKLNKTLDKPEFSVPVSKALSFRFIA